MIDHSGHDHLATPAGRRACRASMARVDKVAGQPDAADWNHPHLGQIISLARMLLDAHDLIEWRFEFDRARRRFGACHYGPRLITMSRELALANTIEVCSNTIKHEIAHALTDPMVSAHGSAWRQMAVMVGADPVRCYNSDKVNVPTKRWRGVCPRDPSHVYKRDRRTFRASCGHCGTGRVYDPALQLTWTLNTEES